MNREFLYTQQESGRTWLYYSITLQKHLRPLARFEIINSRFSNAKSVIVTTVSF